MARHLWLIYALGGGFGHLTRACSLARAAHPDTQVRILTNSPYADLVRRGMPDLDVVVLDPAMTVDRGRAEVLRYVASAAADCLIVDTFPRGLGGELVNVIPAFPGLKVLVQRDLNPQYAAVYHLNDFVAEYYDLVFAPGEVSPGGLATVTTAPWLIRSSHELWPRDRARRFLGLNDEKPCVLVCAAGNSEELAWYGAVVCLLVECTSVCHVRCISPVRPEGCPPECWVEYWPAMDLYPAADVVIGGAGYNTVYECAACDVPLVAKPWTRKYDRQHLRALRAARQVDEPRQAASAALELLGARARRVEKSLDPADTSVCATNGVTEAVARIWQMSDRGRI